MILSLALSLLAVVQTEDTARAERIELAELQPAINSAINDGVAFLLATQLADGSWDHLSELYPNGATALSVLALLKSGLSPEHPNVKAALTTLIARAPEETYSAGVELMALEATRNEFYQNKMEPILEDLLDWQVKGGWSYPADRGGDALVPVKGTLDLSNIQYAALGLRAARFAEYEIKDRVWKAMVDETLGYQTESGGFHYWKEKHSRFAVTGSMTAAGIAILRMAREALGERSYREIDESVENALTWLNDNFSVATNPADRSGAGGHLFYYLFGIERVGSFLEIERIGDRNWYLEGAKRIVREQFEDGSWTDPPTTRELRLLTRDKSSSDISDTCFALLFLRKASARSGELSTKPDTYSSSDPSDEVQLQATGRSGGLTLWISDFSNAVKSRHGSGSIVHGLRVAQVIYSVDGEPVAKIEANPTVPWKSSERFTQNIWLGEGQHHITVRVAIVDAKAPRGARDATIELLGAGFHAEVSHHSQRFDPQLTGLAGRNLIDRASKVEASSNEANARFAIDGIFATRWLSEPQDKQPEFSIQLKQPKRASTLLLCQAARRHDERRSFDRASKLSIRINRQKEPLIVDAPESILTPIRIELEEPLLVRTLDIQVIERKEGTHADGQLGFSEIAIL